MFQRVKKFLDNNLSANKAEKLQKLIIKVSAFSKVSPKLSSDIFDSLLAKLHLRLVT